MLIVPLIREDTSIPCDLHKLLYWRSSEFGSDIILYNMHPYISVRQKFYAIRAEVGIDHHRQHVFSPVHKHLDAVAIQYDPKIQPAVFGIDL